VSTLLVALFIFILCDVIDIEHSFLFLWLWLTKERLRLSSMQGGNGVTERVMGRAADLRCCTSLSDPHAPSVLLNARYFRGA